MAQQTAVEWLIRNVNENIPPLYIPKQVVEQAKQMEKEQIIDAFDTGTIDDNLIGNEYYNNTYV